MISRVARANSGVSPITKSHQNWPKALTQRHSVVFMVRPPAGPPSRHGAKSGPGTGRGPSRPKVEDSVKEADQHREWPGRCRAKRTPDPSPTQNTPKLVSITPTKVLIVFSGTSDSWRANTIPTPVTSTAAAAAASAAIPSRFSLAPRRLTMSTTSVPSKKTPLKATANPTPSRPFGLGAPVAVPSAPASSATVSA